MDLCKLLKNDYTGCVLICPKNFSQVCIFKLLKLGPSETGIGICWIELDGPEAWRMWSPDLNPLDFLLWKYLKRQMYHAEL